MRTFAIIVLSYVLIGVLLWVVALRRGTIKPWEAGEALCFFAFLWPIGVVVVAANQADTWIRALAYRIASKPSGETPK